MPASCCFSEEEVEVICLFRGLLRLLYVVMDAAVVMTARAERPRMRWGLKLGDIKESSRFSRWD